MLKILHLCYTPPNRKNGGAKRSFEINKVLQKYYNVETISIDVEHEENTEYKNSIFYINKNDFQNSQLKNYKLMGSYIIENKKFLEIFLKRIEDYKNDIILVSGMFWFPLIQYIYENNFFKGKLIYDSHFKSHDTDLWKEAELFLKNKADCILSTSYLDHNVLGNKSKIFRSSSDRYKYKENFYWKNKLNNGFLNYVYVASNYSVNVYSIEKIIPLLPSNVKIWAVGEIYKTLEKYNNSNIESLGILEHEELTSLIQYSDGIIIPVLINDNGSNVKTAEAIVSYKAVIGTKESFIGFEDFLNQPGIFCFDTFEMMVEEMKKTHKKFYKRYINDLLWENSLKDLNNHIKFHLNI